MKTRHLIYFLGLMGVLYGSAVQAQNKKSQTVTVEGVVVDENNKPVEGVVVKVQEKRIESLTGKDGHFYMLVDPFDVLVVDVDGYRPIVTPVMGKDSHTLKLEKFLHHENEMVGVAYGEQSKRSITSAISSIGVGEISKNSVTSIQQAMDGTLSGLYSMRNGGENIGKNNFNFFVRGKATNATATPLIFVDNMEANIDLIDFNEVESISVLKDAAALALYGMRGANGVILIKTKHGSDIRHSINVDIRAGIQQADRLSDRLNALQYTTLYNEGLVNDGSSPIYNTDAYLNPNRDAFLYPDENYADRYLKRTTPFQHYNMTASGGNKIAKYFISTGYMKQERIFETNAGDSYERFNVRSNLDVNPFKGMEVNLSVFAALDKNYTPYYDNKTVQNASNDIFNTLMTLPANAFPLFNKDGSLGGTSQYRTNPEGLLNRSGVRKDETRLLNMQLRGKYDLTPLLPGLSIDMSYGFENYNMQYTKISHSYAVFQEQPNGSYTQFGNDDNQDSRGADMMGGFYRYSTLGAGIDYTKSLAGKHDLAVRLQYNHSIETSPGDNPDYKYQSLALRAQYGFKKRYYAEFTTSYNASNYYTHGDRGGFFPALGLAWIMSDEAWMKNLEAVDYLKFRTSFGINGNDRTGGRRFPYRQEFSSGGNYSFWSDAYGMIEGTLANPDETWEKAYKFNFGMDMELFKGLSLTADYFYEKRTDILVPYSNSVPNLIGIDMAKYNFGKIQNQGMDMNIMYAKQYANGGFFVGGNMLFAKNKVLELGEINYEYGHQFLKGHSINTQFGFLTDGIYTSKEELVNAPSSSFGTPALGDIKYVNQNPQDGNMIDDVDKVALGNTFPELIYGLTLGGNFKGFDIQCNLEGSSCYSMFYIPGKFTTWTYNNRWNPAQPNVMTAYPRVSIENDYSRQTSDFWKQDINMLRISSAEIGYTLPSKWVKKVMLSNVRLYVNANNLVTFSNLRDGRNPEAVNAGYSQYPLLRTISFGISLKL